MYTNDKEKKEKQVFKRLKSFRRKIFKLESEKFSFDDPSMIETVIDVNKIWAKREFRKLVSLRTDDTRKRINSTKLFLFEKWKEKLLSKDCSTEELDEWAKEKLERE